VPYLSAIPGIIVLLTVISHVLGFYFSRWRPEWTKPFISERPPECFELSPEGGKQRVGWVLALFTLSLIGLTAELVQLVPPRMDAVAMMLPFSWVSVFLICRGFY
jgi:hypothetical protein